MAFWIFKISQQESYLDIHGEKYVYDNTHSIRVAKEDYFIYLDKTAGYAFTATGVIKKITQRKPSVREAKRNSKVRTVYTAHLDDVVWFDPSISIASTNKSGKRNRALLGIEDVNLLGWSQSISRLSREMYDEITSIGSIRTDMVVEEGQDYSIPDRYSIARARRSLKSFKVKVLSRSGCCVVCGCTESRLLDAAHLSPYASDRENRSNPANGISLCKFCHSALDLRLIAIQPDGELQISESVSDPVVLYHFSLISNKQRCLWLTGVGEQFLELTLKWFEDADTNVCQKSFQSHL